jgi:hypothetical protein
VLAALEAHGATMRTGGVGHGALIVGVRTVL